MFDADTIEFLESGCALVVGTVGPDGEPFASRGWGVTIAEPESNRLRLLLDAADDVAVENVTTTGRVAITAGDVRTLHSIQLKGRIRVIPLAGDADRACMESFGDAFISNVEATDGTDRRLLEQWMPLELVACEVEVEGSYNQTPGPGAGSAVSRDDTAT